MKYLNPCLILGLFSVTASTMAYQITLAPAATAYHPNPALLDANVGFPARNLVVEVFEDEALIPQIKANIKGHVASDPDGTASAWDGEWPSTPSGAETTFDIQIANVRAFGIGWSNLEASAAPELTINAEPPVKLQGLSGHTTNPEGRAMYLKVEAQAGEPEIRSIRLSNVSKVRFDHLVLQQSDDKAIRREIARPPVTEAVTGAVAATVTSSNSVPDGALSLPPVSRVTAEVTAETIVKPPRSEINGASPAPTHPVEAPARAADQVQTPAMIKSAGLPGAEVWKNGVSLLAKAGRRHIGEQLNFFFVDPDGAIASTKVQWINLYLTEGKPFRLHGYVWFSGFAESAPAVPELQDGFALFVREWDGAQRYVFTPHGIEVRGRQHQNTTTNLAKSEDLPIGKWIPFYVDASWDRILYVFGDRHGVVKGPLDMDGANKIAVAPGVKLKDVRLEVFLGVMGEE